jgi:sugar lactone lactonase YvrE
MVAVYLNMKTLLLFPIAIGICFFMSCNKSSSISRPTITDSVITVAGGVYTSGDSAANQLFSPNSVFVDANGNIYVADVYNHRIQKFPAGSTSGANGITVAGGNGYGSSANQFSRALSVFVDASGNIYVADFDNNRIQKFPAGSNSTTNGITIAGGNGHGSAANQLFGPVGVFVDNSGNVYVADQGNSRIQKFPAGSTSATNGITIAGNIIGSSITQGIYIDAIGNTYVADLNNFCVLKFPPGSTSVTNGIIVAGGNGSGTALNQLASPAGIFVDGAGYIYVADWVDNRVMKFPPNSSSATNGIIVAGGNGQGSAMNQFASPVGIFVDATGSIYVADMFNNRIQKWVY